MTDASGAAAPVPDRLILERGLSFGMVLPRLDRTGTIDFARRIEAAGFDGMWMGDHIAFHIPIPDTLTTLAFAAAVTERIRLGTSVYLLPLRHPTITAKVTATLDQLSGGRLDLGIGVGGEFPPEFEAVGVPVAERGPRTDEALHLLRRLWTEDEVAAEGRFFRFGAVTLRPKPLQPGGPPILVGGRRGATFRRAGALGDGYISHMCSPEHYRQNLALIGRAAAEAGRDDVPFATAAFLFTYPDDDGSRALDRAAASLEEIYNRPFRDAAARYTLLGRPAAMVERIRAFAAAGVRRFIFSVPEDPAGFIAMFEREIRPALAGIDRDL